jgi:hypothetical protein
VPYQPIPLYQGPPACNTEALILGFDAMILKPVVGARLSGVVEFPPGVPGGSTRTIAVPQNRLDWTFSPAFEIGYRFPDDLGAVLFTYRFLGTSGSGQGVVDEALTPVRSRLDFNVFDFDYVSPRYFPRRLTALRFYLGARIATSFFDSGTPADPVFRHVSNYWSGAGPHVALEAEYGLPFLPALALYGRIDNAILFGSTRQRFNGTTDDGSGNLIETQVIQDRSRTIPMLSFEAGLSIRPFGFERENFRLAFGYQFEQWWNLGRNSGYDATVQTQGLFLRAEVDF